MPITPTYPGVYIEELQNPVKAIVGVSTSMTAFIGYAKKGIINEPMIIHNFGDYERAFGGLWKKSTMSYAVYQYFLNGGVDAVIVRVAPSDAVTTVFSNAGEPDIRFEAASAGAWANNLTIFVDHDVNPEGDADNDLFNIKVKELVKKGDPEENNVYADLETFLNVSYKQDHFRYVKNVLKEASQLVNVSSINLSKKAEAGKYSPTTPGTDGTQFNDIDFRGSKADKTGLYALDKTDIFNLLCIPQSDPNAETNTFNSALYNPVYTEGEKYCADRRAVLIIDPPQNWQNRTDPLSDVHGISKLQASENAAIYFPRIKCPDPLEENRLRAFGPSGAIAGIIARTDTSRGVWKAPAGTEAILNGVSELTVKLTDSENGELNPLGINCLRVFPIVGRVVWGARTMKGADRLTNQWKYLPVRRTALYIEESLYRGTQWAVFEPNDEPLWGQLRLNVRAFMQDLFTKGAFQGSTPKEAYLVRCDKETTTQTDIDRGIVNIIVGFAPLKPAEFIIIKIQQLAGQTEAR
jgi:phage tail sheath protein FI